MKTKILIISIIAVFMATLSVEAQNKKTNHNKTVTFEVTMTCENCKKTIEKNIAFEKGMKDMKVDLDNKLVTLTFDSRKNNEQKIIEAFSKLGYDAVVMKNKKS
jgi:copper chaperone CopZ